MNASRPHAAEPTFIKGQRIVRLREVRTSMPPFVMVTWAVSDLQTPAEAAVVVAAKRAARAAALPADVAEDLVAGRLSQRCEPCGITEAAGGYCTSCGRLTGPADWFRAVASEAQKAAHQATGRIPPEGGATALETANPEPLGLWPA